MLAALLLACDNAGKPIPQNTSSTTDTTNTKKPQTAIAHSLEKQTPNNGASTGEKSKWTQSGDPIDTKEFDTANASAYTINTSGGTWRVVGAGIKVTSTCCPALAYSMTRAFRSVRVSRAR